MVEEGAVEGAYEVVLEAEEQREEVAVALPCSLAVKESGGRETCLRPVVYGRTHTHTHTHTHTQPDTRHMYAHTHPPPLTTFLQLISCVLVPHVLVLALTDTQIQQMEPILH